MPDLLIDPAWVDRIARKAAEQVSRLDSGSTSDSDDDPEATGALIDFLEYAGDPKTALMDVLVLLGLHADSLAEALERERRAEREAEIVRLIDDMTESDLAEVFGDDIAAVFVAMRNAVT